MIGLIFGDTDFPKEILKKIKRKKLKYLIIDLSKKRTFKKDKNSKKVSIGQFGKIINLLKENRCKKVLFAGKVTKPNFFKLRLDFKGVYYMPRIIKSSRIGDAAILKEIIEIFKKEKITTISSLFFNPELTLKKGIYTKIRPSSFDNIDIVKKFNFGKKYQFLDKIFLRVLERYPEKMPKIFFEMFKTSSTTIIKFLSNKSNIIEDINIINKMPKVIFLKALLN